MGKGLGDWNASVTCIFSWQHSLTEGNGQPSVDCSRVDYAHAVGWKRGAGRMDDSLFMTSVIVLPPQVQPFLPHPSLWEIGMQVLLASFLGSIH